jgi:hypothetical protein
MTTNTSCVSLDSSQDKDMGLPEKKSSANRRLETFFLGCAQLRAPEQKPGGKQTAERTDYCPRFSGQGVAAQRTNEQRQQRQAVCARCAISDRAIGNRYMHLLANGGLPRVEHAKGAWRATEHLADVVTTAAAFFMAAAATGLIHPHSRIFTVNRGNASWRINHGFEL